MTRPIVPAALALLGGIAVGDALNLGPETSALCLLLAAASLITALARGATLAAAVSVHLGLAAAGVLAIGAAVNPRIDGNHVALYVSGDPVTLEGILYRWPEQRNGRTLLYLRTEYVDYVGIDEGDRPVSGNMPGVNAEFHRWQWKKKRPKILPQFDRHRRLETGHMNPWHFLCMLQ